MGIGPSREIYFCLIPQELYEIYENNLYAMTIILILYTINMHTFLTSIFYNYFRSSDENSCTCFQFRMPVGKKQIILKAQRDAERPCKLISRCVNTTKLQYVYSFILELFSD